ncbi:excinuclease ABC subunit UvrB [Patescibacteria group bacterium]|nr:excinuclease ABC subunit UvrB [Patescibacteria group bacterium]
MYMNFNLKSKYKPSGDQPQAIELLTKGIEADINHQTLLGVTGSGKTFTMASVIQNVQKPTLIISHNKTLAAQLYGEFKTYFPDNAVSYFVSYYDYYQPEAYVPKRDMYIEKEADINESIERYRSSATQSLLTRKDVVIVASVSCIYGLGNPQDYMDLSRKIVVNENYSRNKLIRHLGDLQYERSEYDFYSGQFRVRGDTIDVYTAADETAVRVEFFGNEVEALKVINPVSGEVLDTPKEITIFPAKQFVTPYEALIAAIPQIENDLKERIKFFKKQGRDLEAHRIEQRVNYDIEMLRETGYCSGIENYSRYIENRKPGSPPSTLLDYYPDDWLLFFDESHMTIPQIRGMYNGDRARKEILVDYGFRLTSALDNRPLQFAEFKKRINQAVYVSATPSEYEIKKSQNSPPKADHADRHASQPLAGNLKSQNLGGIIEQLIRPTGLLDPRIEIRPSETDKKETLVKELESNNLKRQANVLKKRKCLNQIDDLIGEIKSVTSSGNRALVTTLTKRMAEDLSAYLKDIGIKVQYLHSEIDTVERVEILRDLRLGKYDVVVGINLLREGLDLPEVALVAILDADKEGFLRSDVSLIQTIGRAARHKDGYVIMYADKVTGSMKRAVLETKRRRKVQEKYNEKHNITPTSITKEIKDQLERLDDKQDEKKTDEDLHKRVESFPALNPKERKKLLNDLEVQMLLYSDMLEFEKAAELRDLIKDLKGK